MHVEGWVHSAAPGKSLTRRSAVACMLHPSNTRPCMHQKADFAVAAVAASHVAANGSIAFSRSRGFASLSSVRAGWKYKVALAARLCSLRSFALPLVGFLLSRLQAPASDASGTATSVIGVRSLHHTKRPRFVSTGYRSVERSRTPYACEGRYSAFSCS